MDRGRGHCVLFTLIPGGSGDISQGKVRANIPCTTALSSFNEVISLYNHNSYGHIKKSLIHHNMPIC